MKKRERNNTIPIKVACALILLLGIAVSAVISAFHVSPVKINIPDYILIHREDNDAYSFALDTDRILYEYCFPEDKELPECLALESLSLLVSSTAGGTQFEVGSTLENAGEMLLAGGYSLSNTVWQWSMNDVSAKYTSSLDVTKHISLKAYVSFCSDGNYNWVPSIDYDGLFTSVGDRIQYDETLKALLLSLSVSGEKCADGSYKMETWSTYASPNGLTVEQILESCKISLTDTVFIMSTEQIRSLNLRNLSFKQFVKIVQTDTGTNVELDKDSMKAYYKVNPGTAAAEAVDSFSIQTEIIGGTNLRVSVYSTVTGMDAVKVLTDNGIILQDTVFDIQL